MLSIGRILKSYGTDGGLLVSPAFALEDLEKEEPVFIEFDGLQVPFFIVDCTPKASRYIVHLTDITTLADADEVVGREIFADLEEEADGPDFIGWTVFDIGAAAQSGKGSAKAGLSSAEPHRVGVVTGDEPIPGNYCICIGDILIPLHEDFIVSADPSRKELVLNLPSGLY